ncbi:hypothetical protein [Natrinema amylolyticum]|nr:hypothetical protein [Natrinema amylolyticum]
MELDFSRSFFGVYADIGTVNYGDSLAGSGLVANSSGYVVN